MAYKTRPGESQFAARTRIAREKGFASYREYRGTSGQVRERASRELAARDAGYGSRIKQTTSTIRRRARARVETPAGTTLTSTDMRRVRRHIMAATPGDLVSFYAIVQLDGIDRRRRDKRRKKGRDTAYRTLRFTRYTDDFDTTDVDSFTDDFDAAIDAELDRLYVGDTREWSLDTLGTTIPRTSSAVAA